MARGSVTPKRPALPPAFADASARADALRQEYSVAHHAVELMVKQLHDDGFTIQQLADESPYSYGTIVAMARRQDKKS